MIVVDQYICLNCRLEVCDRKQLVQNYVSDGSYDDFFNEDEIENANGVMS